MTRQNNNRQKASRKAKRGRRAGQGGYALQRSTANHVYEVNNGPWRSPPIPREFSVALVMQDSDSYSVTGQGTRRLGMLEFLNLRPLYTTQLFTLYKKCKITGVSVVLDMINTGTAPVQVTMAWVPDSDFQAGVSQDRLTERPGAVRKVASLAGGIDRVRLSKTFNCQQIVGNPSFSKYWFDVTQSTSSTVIDADEPIILISVDDVQGASIPILATIMYRVTYHCQFFDLETPAAS